jgi:cytochrome c oxidase subunit 2
MFLRKTGIGAATAALLAFAAYPAVALPHNWGTSFQAAASPIMEQIETFHTELFWICVAVCLFVLALLVWIVIKYRAGANAVPSKVHHNTLLEVAWTLIPVIILVVIAIPSFKLLYLESTIPPVDVHIKAIGKQWFWTYEYPAPPPASLMTASACRMPTRPRRTSRACWVPTIPSMSRSTR